MGEAAEKVVQAPSTGHGAGIDSSRVATLMTNVIVGIPIGGQSGAGVRPPTELDHVPRVVCDPAWLDACGR